MRVVVLRYRKTPWFNNRTYVLHNKLWQYERHVICSPSINKFLAPLVSFFNEHTCTSNFGCAWRLKTVWWEVYLFGAAKQPRQSSVKETTYWLLLAAAQKCRKKMFCNKIGAWCFFTCFWAVVKMSLFVLMWLENDSSESFLLSDFYIKINFAKKVLKL